MHSPSACELLDRAGREGGYVVEVQRQRLLIAFGDVLTEEGLEAAAVGRVCARAGVSRRTFYNLFADREDCFGAVFDAAVEQIAARIIPLFIGEGRWRDRIRGAITALLEIFDENPVLVSVCLIEPVKGGPAMHERRVRVSDALAAAVDQGRLEAMGTIEPAPLTAESVTGGALSVVVARSLQRDRGPLRELVNPLMSMIVQPYLGRAAARRELEREISPPPPVAINGHRGHRRIREPFKGLPIRITLRTARVLMTIAAQPGTSNRHVADAAGVADQGQMSKLLSRLEHSGLVENHSRGHESGEPNAWHLTERGWAVQRAIEVPGARASLARLADL